MLLEPDTTLDVNYDPTPGNPFLWTKEDIKILNKAVRVNRVAKKINWSSVKRDLDKALPKELTITQIKTKHKAIKQEMSKEFEAQHGF